MCVRGEVLARARAYTYKVITFFAVICQRSLSSYSADGDVLKRTKNNIRRFYASPLMCYQSRLREFLCPCTAVHKSQTFSNSTMVP